MNESPTPRADAEMWTDMENQLNPVVTVDFARQLERELSEANVLLLESWARENVLTLALKTFGQHSVECEIHLSADRSKCNCGLSASLTLPAPPVVSVEELEKAKKEVEAWKANHDNQVKLKAILMDRPDLKDRAKRMQELIAELTKAENALKALGYEKHGFGWGFAVASYCNAKGALAVHEALNPPPKQG